MIIITKQIYLSKYRYREHHRYDFVPNVVVGKIGIVFASFKQRVDERFKSVF